MRRKIREVIKEDKEEKDSLLNEIKYKSQAAMEYLMTYGWAILIIALTLGVLYSLGIVNPKNFIPRAPPGSCFVFRPNGPGTTDFVSLQGTCGYLPMYVASFNGVNGYITVPYVPQFNIGYTGKLTIAFWGASTVSSRTSWGGVVTKNRESSSVSSWYGVWLSPSNPTYWHFRFSTVTSNTVPAIVNKWYFIVIVMNTSQAIGYINGVKVITLSATATDDTYPLYIGRAGGVSEFMNGTIANVQIYNVALSDQEVQYLYQEGLGGGPIRLGSLVGWWPLNGDAKDYSGNNNHGTINGGVTFVQNYNPS